MANINVIEVLTSTLKSNTKKKDEFLSVSNSLASTFQQSSKLLYDFTNNKLQRKSNALPELVIQGFDDEQIWQQLEICNEEEFTQFLPKVSRLCDGNNKLELSLSITELDQKLQENEQNTEDENDDEENENEDEEAFSEPELSGSDDEMDLDMDLDGNLKKKKKVEVKKKRKHPSIVDDKFFKLEELDEYLNKEDNKESKDNEDDTDKSDEESVDLFDGNSEPEDDEDPENARMIKYTGFFDSPESAEEDESPNNDDKNSEFNPDDENADNNKKRKLKESQSSEKRVKFNLTNDSDDTDSIENHKLMDQENEDIKSTLEHRNERVQKHIEKYENELISEKPWQLKGEVTGPNRPQNSLLEEFVEFDVTSRPAPVITEQTTIKLEDIIRQRIKDKAWDSVERKFKPVETPLEYKKKLVMDQEKSQKSLAQIYEDAYLKQKDALNPNDEEREKEEPKEHKEIRELMHSLFNKLDALSNFHYTPKLAQPEIKIISNVPAIDMEEVAPIATTDATLLAPEEVKGKPRGNVVGKSERTKTDMKRERRKKKVLQREKQKVADKKELNLTDLKVRNKKQAKSVQTAMVKKLTKDRNISAIDESSHKLPKSSTAFFSQLQDQVSSQIKAKTGKSLQKKDKSLHSAVKLKL